MAKKSSVPPTTSDFPKVGSYDSVVNMSGQRSPYTMPEARKGPMNDNPPDSSAAKRGATMIRDADGPTFRPVATRGWAPGYGETGRGMRIMPSRTGLGDFWSSRSSDNYGETIG